MDMLNNAKLNSTLSAKWHVMSLFATYFSKYQEVFVADDVRKCLEELQAPLSLQTKLGQGHAVFHAFAKHMCLMHYLQLRD